MNSEARRSMRIQQLTAMALRGAKLEELEALARKWASPPVAQDYIENMQSNVRKIYEKRRLRVRK